MPTDDHVNERTHLLTGQIYDRRLSAIHDEEARSVRSSHVSKEEEALGGSTVGERLPYNDYTTIDWLHDLVKDSYRWRALHLRKGFRARLYSAFDASISWIAVAIMGTCTAVIAWLVDVAQATVSDYKLGYCAHNLILSRENCCRDAYDEAACDSQHFVHWADSYAAKYAIYVGFALAFGIISSSATMLTKASLPAVSSSGLDKTNGINHDSSEKPTGKKMYMAAGSGIPEIKTILSGFVIPNFLDFKVLVVKAFGAVFAVSTGMCLGKEGPFVHVSTCVGYLVARLFSKYRNNGRKMREMLSAACASGLSVAFGAPIGGVLFAYEEISTYFPRPVMWHAFLCSLFAAMVLKALNPNGTGKLVLFETDYGTSYQPIHYLVFILLGIAGGIFGGVFCKANFIWSKWFRSFPVIKNYPVFEAFLIVLVTALIQFPNILIRDPGDVTIKMLLVDCKGLRAGEQWVCRMEQNDDKSAYIGWLLYGCLAKLLLTIITFGVKVPSGVIIPALDAGALFGRIIGQVIPGISPGIFAMVGAGAFLGGVSRMTISLCVIMFELTGEIEYIVPHMIAILIAKWVADALSKEGVYDLAQTVLGHPFLDSDHSMSLVRQRNALVADLIPPAQTMAEITVNVPASNKVSRKLLQQKLAQLHRRGLMDAGLVLVQNGGMLQGYIAEAELDFGLNEIGKIYGDDADVRLLGDAEEGEFDLSVFVDRTPVTMNEKAPMELAVEMFGKLGLRHMCILEEGTSRLVGVVIKKRLVAYLESIAEGR